MCWRGVGENEGEIKEGGEGGEYKKGMGLLSFPSRVGEGNEGLWAQVDPTDDITASSSLLLFFPFPLSGRPLRSPWSMHVLQYSLTEQRN